MDQPGKAMIIKVNEMYIPSTCRVFQVVEPQTSASHNNYQVRKNE